MDFGRYSLKRAIPFSRGAIVVEIPPELKFYLPGQVNPVSLDRGNPLTRVLDLSVEPGVVRSEPL